MIEHKSFSHRTSNALRAFAMVCAVAVFLGVIARFYLPGKGFSALILFGGNHAERYIPEVAASGAHIEEHSYGYDAQWYAQLAIRPDIRDPALAVAIDNLPYRARRILFSWTAHGLGLGRPEWVVQAYALQNVLCWLGLAVLLLRWFKPDSWNAVLRWGAVMFSFGLLASVSESLVDGPGLLLVAAGVALVETGRPWLAALVLGVSGLGKETNVLAAGALGSPDAVTAKARGGVVLRGLLVALPLALWMGTLMNVFGPGGADGGSRAFGAPCVELWRKGGATLAELWAGPSHPSFALSSLWMVISLTVQLLFIALRPRWRETWWRVGAAYGVLMIFLGAAVWEGYPGAASRVLLPMTLAFNILVPKGRAWWPVLLLGNLTVLNSPELLRPPGGDGYAVAGAGALVENAATGGRVRATFDQQWFAAERTLWDYWRWSEGTAAVTVSNPHPFPIKATVAFAIASAAPRQVTLVVDGAERWSGGTGRERRLVRVEEVVLKAGDTVFVFATPEPGTGSGNPSDPRALAFRLYDFKLELKAVEGAAGR